MFDAVLAYELIGEHTAINNHIISVYDVLEDEYSVLDANLFV